MHHRGGAGSDAHCSLQKYNQPAECRLRDPYRSCSRDGCMVKHRANDCNSSLHESRALWSAARKSFGHIKTCSCEQILCSYSDQRSAWHPLQVLARLLRVPDCQLALYKSPSKPFTSRHDVSLLVIQANWSQTCSVLAFHRSSRRGIVEALVLVPHSMLRFLCS